MILLNKLFKRFLAVIMTIAIAASFSTMAFAEEPTSAVPADQNTVNQEVSTQSLGNVIAAATGTITGGSGIISVDLPAGNWWADLRAGIGYASETGVVSCTVLAPNGNSYPLGSMAGTGSYTGTVELAYAPAGTYQFYFYTAITSPIEVIALIYD